MEIGTGTTITFATGFFAEILSVDWSGIEREDIDSTHMGTATARTFEPSDLYDPGELSVTMHHAPATTPPISSAAETITVTFPDSGAATWAASGYMKSYEITSELEGKIEATAVLKFSGAITITP